MKAELERIRQERAVEAEKRAAEEAKRRQSEKESELRGGNPLLAQIAAGQPVDFSVKRRWVVGEFAAVERVLGVGTGP